MALSGLFSATEQHAPRPLGYAEHETREIEQYSGMDIASCECDLSGEDFDAMDEIDLAMREAWIEQVEHEQGDIEDEGFFDNPEVELRTQHIGG